MKMLEHVNKTNGSQRDWYNWLIISLGYVLFPNQILQAPFQVLSQLAGVSVLLANKVVLFQTTAGFPSGQPFRSCNVSLDESFGNNNQDTLGFVLSNEIQM